MKTKQLSANWKEVELGNEDYFEILSSGIEKFEGEKDYLSTESIKGTKIKKIECVITLDEKPSRANMQPVLNSIWFAKMQATLKVYCFDETNKGEIGKYILSTGFAGIKVNENEVYPEYLRLIFTSKWFNKEKDNLSTGSTQRGINNTFIKKIKISLPTLPIQKKMVQILEQAKQLKQQREQADKLTEEYLKSVFNEMFLKKDFEKVEINSGVLKTENKTPEKDFPENYFEYVDIASIDNKTKRIVETKKILGKDAPSRAKQLIKFKDILISTVRPNLNAVALVSNNLDNQICSTGYCILRADSKTFIPEYLFFISQTDFFINFLIRKTRGANYPAVSNNNVKSFEVPLPPLALQKKFASIVEKVEKIKEAQKKSKQEINDLFNALMQKAFRGES